MNRAFLNQIHQIVTHVGSHLMLNRLEQFARFFFILLLSFSQLLHVFLVITRVRRCSVQKRKI